MAKNAMSNFVLTTSEKTRFLLSKEEYKAFLQAVKNKVKFVTIQGAFIPLQILPSVVPFHTWYFNETEKLAVSGKRLCKLCLSVMENRDVCACWPEMGKDEKRIAFKFKEIAPKLFERLQSKIKDFPQLAEGEAEEADLKYRLL